MFTVCPHCQFLVARDPHSGAVPTACPRCGKPLATADDATSPAPSLATLLHATPANAAPQAPDADVITADAIDNAVAEVPSVEMATPPTAAPVEAPSPPEDAEHEAVPRDDASPHHDAAAPDPLPSPDTAPARTPDAAIATPVAARKATGPRFLHRARTTPVHAHRARALWAVVIALSLLLCLQVVIADRARLAMQAGWRPVVVALCGVFRCEVPTWREPAAFTMLSRDVRPVPGAPGTLQAQATFRNEARWAQGWPVILLTLKDADGRTLGARALQPEDYLPDGETTTAIGPGQSAQMAVRIREPSASVVAFSFDFR